MRSALKLVATITALTALLTTPAFGQDYGGRPPDVWEAAPDASQTRVTVEVRPHHSVAWLARRFEVDTNQVRRWNDLNDAEEPAPGSRVVLYVEPEALPRHMRRVTHRVVAGESFKTIAAAYGVSPGDLKSWNWRLRPGGLTPGSTVFVYLTRRRAGGARFPGATQLTDGPGYRVRNPMRAWGTAAMVELLQDAFREMHRRAPDAAPLHVGDLSHPEGGFIAPHLSHRRGRDVDIAYYTDFSDTTTRFAPVTPDTLDADKTWALLSAMLATGRVQMVFVDYALQRPLYEAAKRQGVSSARLRRLFQYPNGPYRGAGVIMHWPGHDDHFHVRIR